MLKKGRGGGIRSVVVEKEAYRDDLAGSAW
jgi:hypothetical protein